jgi:four helix bundle protein
VTFERLRVYEAAELFDQVVLDLVGVVPRGHSRDVDQLRRAAGSVVFNIAEAYGSEQIGRKLNFLEIARGSADEVRAILRRFVRVRALSADQTNRANGLAITLAKMLTAWIATLKRRP